MQGGIPAALIYEDLEILTPYMHTQEDVVGKSLNSPELLEGNARLALASVAVLAGPLSAEEGTAFLRGDSNGDGVSDIADAVHVLLGLFAGLETDCDDARDADDDGALLVTDAIALLDFLFRGGPSPPAPFPFAGRDPTPDALGCAR